MLEAASNITWFAAASFDPIAALRDCMSRPEVSTPAFVIVCSRVSPIKLASVKEKLAAVSFEEIAEAAALVPSSPERPFD